MKGGERVKTYILKFLFGGVKHSCRVMAHSFEAAEETAEKMVDGLLGGRIVSIAECPVQI